MFEYSVQRIIAGQDFIQFNVWPIIVEEKLITNYRLVNTTTSF